MKKLLLSLIVIFLTSCSTDHIGQDPVIPIIIWLPDADTADAIDLIDFNGSEDYKIGTLREIVANDGPGLRFLGWRKGPSYCDHQPIIDEEDPRKAYIFIGEDYMGNCNAPTTPWVRIEPMYIRVFN